jgi:hypothetical protein
MGLCAICAAIRHAVAHLPLVRAGLHRFHECVLGHGLVGGKPHGSCAVPTMLCPWAIGVTLAESSRPHLTPAFCVSFV